MKTFVQWNLLVCFDISYFAEKLSANKKTTKEIKFAHFFHLHIKLHKMLVQLIKPVLVNFVRIDQSF